jgi:hypothetical protein
VAADTCTLISNYYFRNELRILLEKAGFTIETEKGDWAAEDARYKYKVKLAGMPAASLVKIKVVATDNDYSSWSNLPLLKGKKAFIAALASRYLLLVSLPSNPQEFLRLKEEYNGHLTGSTAWGRSRYA